MKRITVYALFILILSGSTLADRLLDRNETEMIIRQLTDTPRKAWIPQGMIQARHMEYYEYDNSMREATETIYCSDSQFRFEITLEDGAPTESLSDQSLSRQFEQDFKLNRSRTFVWDGKKYTQYYQSADYAIVALNSAKTPEELCGPITAGIIPWGHGDFTFLVIMSQDPECREILRDGRHLISMTYISDTISPETAITFVLDHAKAYAVLSYSIENDQALLRQTYEAYTEVGDRWVPSRILIERLDKRPQTPQLISYEDWQFEHIDTTEPAADIFSVNFKNGTMVELKAAGNLQTFMYHASDQVDISALLEDKIALMTADNPDSVNCATAVISHVAKRFSKDIPSTELADLVLPETKKTALSTMKQTFEKIGLTCMAIETDLETLKNIPNCRKILYLSLSKHYVILDRIDQNGAWVIDLTNRKFYARQNVSELLQEWTDGTALLVSNEPINPPLDAQFRYLQPDEIGRIYGGADFGTYSCTDLIQLADHILCPDPLGGFLCGGAYYIFYERYGCIEDENGGTCNGEKMISYEYYHCINHPYKPGACLTLDTPVSRYIRACR